MGIYLTGEVARKSPLTAGDSGLITLCAEGEEIPDLLNDDLSVVIDSPRGLILLLGCAHAGLINIVSQVRERTGRDRFYAVLGGTHLGFSGEEETEAAVRMFEEIGAQKVGASHCTGPAAAARLQARLQERFFFAHTGTALEV